MSFIPTTLPSGGLNQQILLILPQEQAGENIVLLPQQDVIITETMDQNVNLNSSQFIPRKPYFTSVEGYTSNKDVVGGICRTCYRAIFNEHYVKLSNDETGNKLRTMLTQIVPDLDLEIYAEPVMCVKCVKSLLDSYAFKTKCLETEAKFNEWIAQRMEVPNDEVNLVILVDSSTDADEIPPENPPAQPQKNPQPAKICPTKATNKKPKYTCETKPTNYLQFKKRYSFNALLTGKTTSTNLKKKKGPFLCDKCGQVFKARQTFLLHASAHSGTPVNPLQKCSQCDKHFPTKIRLQRHVTTCHSGMKSHLCYICGRVFKYPGALKCHMEIHKVVYRCDICGKILKNAQSLRRHNAIFHKKGGHECDVCGKMCFSRENLANHKARFHQPGKELQCKDCKVYFQNKARYDRHVANHGIFQCEVCGKILKSRFTKKKHVALFHGDRGRHTCKVCDAHYTDKVDLFKHEMRAHQNKTVEEAEGAKEADQIEAEEEGEIDKENTLNKINSN